MIVRFRAPKTHDSALEGALAPGQCYSVIGIEADDYRILDDTGRPFLYSASAFDVVDAAEPTDWISELGEDGERYAYPAELNAPGFFEDFFDNDPAAVATFWHKVNARLSNAA
jgi:hypothetical protein